MEDLKKIKLNILNLRKTLNSVPPIVLTRVQHLNLPHMWFIYSSVREGVELLGGGWPPHSQPVSCVPSHSF